jgi:DNA polymerase III epsilon subunit-like protein
MNLFLDTETTGLPPKGANWDVDYKVFPYIVSIAWKIGKRQQYFIIHQEGRVIPKEATAIHGITTKMANDPEQTQPASFVYSMLMCDAEQAINIIGHNLYFDISTIKANILRLHGPKSKQASISNDVFDKDKRLDTMRGSMSLFGKWPKLIDLYKKLFNEEFEAHNALHDVVACERCFIELRKRKIL